MSSKKFWKLSFYEWSLCSLRIRDLDNQRKFDHELMIRLARRMMFVQARVMGSKKVKENDFWPLEGDKTDSVEITDEQLAKLEEVHQARKKKRNKK